MADISKKDLDEVIDTNINKANKIDENSVIKNKKFESRAIYAGNDEVIDQDRDEELDKQSEKKS